MICHTNMMSWGYHLAWNGGLMPIILRQQDISGYSKQCLGLAMGIEASVRFCLKRWYPKFHGLWVTIIFPKRLLSIEFWLTSTYV